MILSLMKSPLFILPLICLIGLIGFSFYYESVIKETVPAPHEYMDADGDGNLDAAPYQPSERFPMGTDKSGFPLHYEIIEGAKYTIGFAFLITMLRMALSVLLGLSLRRILLKLQLVIKGLTNSFHFVPVSLIVFFLLAPMLVVFSWNFEQKTQLIFSISVLTLIAVPTLSLLISSEADQIIRKEYIDNAKILGGGYFHILRKHVRPYLIPRLLVMFNQQIIQVLLLFAHLGVLGLFVGGTNFENVKVDEMLGNQVQSNQNIAQRITSMSNEWGGLIAKATEHGVLFPWQLYYPALALGLTILAFTLMLEGVKRAVFRHEKKKPKRQEGKPLESEESEEDFAKVSNE